MNKKYRKVIIAGNWKMNKMPSEVKPFVEELRAAMPASLKGCSVVLCMPHTHIGALAGNLGADTTPSPLKQKLEDLAIKVSRIGYLAAALVVDSLDFKILGLTFSPVKGPEGNIEFLGHLAMEDRGGIVADIPAIVAAAHEQL